MTRSNYTMTVGIHVGETSGMKASFWLEVLGTTKKSRYDEIGSKSDEVRKSINALCELHEVYVGEKRRHTDGAVGPPSYLRIRALKKRGKRRWSWHSSSH